VYHGLAHDRKEPIQNAAIAVRRLWLIIGWLALTPIASVEASALCLPSRAPLPGQSDAFRYVSAFIDSLEHAKTASARTDKAFISWGRADQPHRELAAMMELTLAVKTSGLEYACAADLVTPFTSGSALAMNTSAKGARGVYQDLQELETQLLRILGSVLDSPGQRVTAPVIERMTDLGLARTEALKALLLAGAAAAHVLVSRPDKPDERLTRLSVTSAERQALIDRLNTAFGGSIRGGMKAGQVPVDATAALLLGFLQDGKWKSLDSK